MRYSLRQLEVFLATAAQENVTRAAEGLADFKQGFEQLERRAAEHRLVVTRLEDARAGLPDDVE